MHVKRDDRMSVFNIWDIPGFEIPEPCRRILRLLMSPETTNTKELSFIAAIIPPGCTTCLHEHQDSSEWMYIVSGRGKCVIDGKETDIGPDTLVYAPKGVKHEIRNTGDETVKIVAIFVPPLKPEGSYKDLIEKTKVYVQRKP